MLCSVSCCTINLARNGIPKFTPQYQGVDPLAQPYVDEFMSLAADKKITFKNKVTIGFKKLNQRNEVGLCTYGAGWREIDIDEAYWEYSSETDRLTLIFHELTHCYCGRNHDYAPDKPYPATEEARIVQAETWQENGGEKPGRLEDGCPSSIMYPIVVSESCVQAHYDHYIEEMFERCKPY